MSFVSYDNNILIVFNVTINFNYTQHVANANLYLHMTVTNSKALW